MSIYSRFMTPDKWYRSFLFYVIIFITFFFLFSMQSFANGTEESEVIYTKNIYHVHTGSSGNGCYTNKRTETREEDCKGGGQCNSGPHGPDTSGQVYYVGNCTVCGARLDRHGSPGYESCDKMTTVSYTYYDLGCNKTPSTVVGVLSVEQNTSKWTKQVILTGSYKNTGNMSVSQNPYIWNGKSATSQNTYTVTGNGNYTLRLNAGENEDTANSIITISINNIDTTAPVITSHILEPESGWVKEGVLFTVGNVRDLQPDNTPGCGLHPKAYSYDNGKTWTADVSHLYKESGSYTVMVRDALENVSSYKVSVQHVDNLAPTIHKIEYDDTPNLPYVTLTVTASDVQADGSNGCGLPELPYSYDGGITWTDSSVYETDTNGTIIVAVRDALDNITYREIVITNIDGCGPEVSYVLEPDLWTNQDVCLHLTAQDKNADGSMGIGLADAWYSLDGGITWSNEEELVYTKNQEVSVIARDKNGNFTYVDFSILHIDKEAPVVSLEMEVTGEGEEKTVILISHAQDSGSGLDDMAYSWDGGECYGSEKSKVVTENGTYEVMVRDMVGNLSREQIVVDVFEEPEPEEEETIEPEPEEEETVEPEPEEEETVEPEPEEEETVEPELPEEEIVEPEEKKTAVAKPKKVPTTLVSEEEMVVPILKEAVVIPARKEESVVASQEEAVLPKEEEEMATKTVEPEPAPVVIKAAPKADKPITKPVRVVEEDTWNGKDTLTVIAAFGACLGLMVLVGFCMINTIVVYVEDEKENMHYLGRLWVHHRDECYEVRFTEVMLEKCVTTHFCLRPSLLFLLKRKREMLSLLFPEDICITLPVSKEMDFSLL